MTEIDLKKEQEEKEEKMPSQIHFRKKEEKEEEMAVVYSFFNVYKKYIYAGLVIIAIAILSINWINQRKITAKNLAADKLFTVKSDFEAKKFDIVITKGLKYSSEFSGQLQSDDILLYVAKAYLAQNKTEKALKVLSKFKKSDNKYLRFSSAYISAVIYSDKWVVKNDKKDAISAAELYLKASSQGDKFYKDQCAYDAANYYFKADDKEQAKSIIDELNTRKDEMGYKLKNKVKDLSERL